MYVCKGRYGISNIQMYVGLVKCQHVIIKSNSMNGIHSTNHKCKALWILAKKLRDLMKLI